VRTTIQRRVLIAATLCLLALVLATLHRRWSSDPRPADPEISSPGSNSPRDLQVQASGTLAGLAKAPDAVASGATSAVETSPDPLDLPDGCPLGSAFIDDSGGTLQGTVFEIGSRKAQAHAVVTVSVVWEMQEEDSLELRMSSGRALTEDDGTFKLQGLRPGNYVLSCESGAEVRVRLGPDESRSGLELTCAARRELSVTVESEDGQPVPDAVVSTLPGVASSRTDLFGVAKLRVPSDCKQVVVEEGNPQSSEFAPHLPEEIPRDGDSMRIRLRKGGFATGTLFDPEGDPARKDLSIQVLVDGRLFSTTSTNDKGRFKALVPARGTVVLQWKPTIKEQWRSRSGRLVLGDARLEEVRSGDRKLALRAQAVNWGASVSVSVRSPLGNPVAGIYLRVETDSDIFHGGDGYTDAEGFLRIENLLERPHRLEFSIGRATGLPGDWLMPAPGEVTPHGQTMTVNLVQGKRVPLSVQLEDGRPGSHARVFICYRNGVSFAEGEANSEGEFEFLIDPLSTEKLSAWASLDLEGVRFRSPQIELMGADDMGRLSLVQEAKAGAGR
jgi:hypothetical protein